MNAAGLPQINKLIQRTEDAKELKVHHAYSRSRNNKYAVARFILDFEVYMCNTTITEFMRVLQ